MRREKGGVRVVMGYIEAIREIEEQFQSGIDKVHAFSVYDDPDYFYDYVQGLLDGLEAGVDSRDIVNIQNVRAKGLGYAINTSQELKFVTEIAATTGIVLDPVYSGKAAYGMLKDMAENTKKWEGRKILFIQRVCSFPAINKMFFPNGNLAFYLSVKQLDLN
ncbi:unnamed protein product [Prunus armeniaca]|uniref:Tryptophan synthase beta chain-like PALP domain-containing protein n=1 Tax=Prunus armeniaca TaxID=36596 RepID=A0A6J5V1Z6_PRUAR|nr:unnamed protein product [Prunus armeniaca]